MRQGRAALVCAVGAMLSVSALADERADCLGSKDNLVAVRACSEIIRRDPKDAIAYYLRGTALARNNDLGQAITDFSKALALDPGLTAAYDGRASAYVSKGDYTSAVADVTKSAEVFRAGKVRMKGTTGPTPAIAKAGSASPQVAGEAKPLTPSAIPKEPTAAVSTKARQDWKSTIFDPSGNGRRGE